MIVSLVPWIASGDFDAIILAAAGLERLELDHHISQQFSLSEMLPAAAQGVLGIECLDSNTELCNVLGQLNDPIALQTTTAERTIVRMLQASCQSPVAAFATVDNGTLSLTALVAYPDGSRYIRKSLSGDATDAQQLGETLAERLLQCGARELLDSIEALHD